MSTEFWRKARRLLAFVLIIALCSSDMPQMFMSVRATSESIIDACTITMAGTELVEVEGNAGVFEATEPFLFEGEAVEPQVSLKAKNDSVSGNVSSGDSLRTDEHYTVVYDGSTGLGRASATIEGVGAYTGKVVIYYDIKKELTETAVTVSGGDNLIYNGTAQKADIIVTDGGVVLTEGTDYKLSYSDHTAAGTVTVTVEFMGNYSGTVTKTYDIKQADIAGLTLTIEAKEYTGKKIEVNSLVVKNGDDVFTECTLIVAKDMINVDEYTITINGTGNYKGSTEADFSIDPVEITSDMIDMETTVDVYAIPDVAVVKDGVTYPEADYTVSCEPENVNKIGTYTVTVEASESGNMTGSATKDFIVTPGTGDVSSVKVDGVYKKDNIYYYENAEDVKITAVDGYLITECHEGGSLNNGTITLNAASEIVKLAVVNTRGNGKVTSVELSEFKQDADAPEITFDAKYEKPYVVDNVTKWAYSMAPEFAVSDEKSGVKKVYRIAEEVALDNIDTVDFSRFDDISNGTTWVAGTTYTVIAVDNVGNRSGQVISLAKLDTTAPVITVKNGEDEVENGSSIYLSEDGLTSHSFVISADDGEGSGVNSVTDNVVFVPQNEQTGYQVFENEAVDNVENKSTHSFEVYYDSAEPRITSVELKSGDENVVTEKTNGSYSISANSTVTITVVATDDVINDISQFDADNVSLALNGDNVSAYSKSSTSDSEGNYSYEYQWIINVKDGEYFNNSYVLKVSDITGNVTTETINVEIDDASPKFEISYSEDAVNETTYNNRVYFAPESDVVVTFHVEENCATFGANGLENCEVAVNNEAVDITWSQSGTKYTGVFTVANNAIHEITIGYADKFGTVMSGGSTVEYGMVDGEGVYTSKTLVVDSTIPQLQVVLEDDSYVDGVDENETVVRYYTPVDDETSETVTLTFTEKFLKAYLDENGDVIMPVIKVNDVEQYVTWGDFDEETGCVVATVELPYDSNGAESRYVITASYIDGSLNKMVLAGETYGSATEGVFTSGIIVLDNKAPELVSYTIDGTTEIVDQNGIPVYQHKDGSDVTITAVIDDNAQYWDESAVTVKLYDCVAQSYVETDLYSVEWDPASTDSTHTMTFTFCAKDLEPTSYYVMLSYSDRAGNAMVTTDVEAGTLAEGVYTSESFVLDHEEPVFTIDFNTAYRLVKNDGTYADDKRNAEPETGYTAYYGDAEGKISVEFTIEEEYARYLLDSEGEFAGLDGETVADEFKFKLTIEKDGKEIEEYPAITWTKNEDVYKGAFELTEEGAYVVSVEYRDTAKNDMIEGTLVEGKKQDVAEGKYVSETLVLDKTAPVITTSYDAEYVNSTVDTANEKVLRKYFDKDANFKITVTDVNARYYELLTGLSNINAVYAPGKDSSIEIPAAVEAIGNIKEDAILSAEDSIVIPLSVDGNYTIPVGMEDLAGNASIWEQDENGDGYELPTIDKSVPEVVVEVTLIDDTTGNVINLEKYADEETKTEVLYHFSKVSVEVTATVTDTISGVQNIAFSFDGDEKREISQMVFEPNFTNSYSVIIPLSQTDYKGAIATDVSDWSNNVNGVKQGVVVEKAGSAENAKGHVTISAPSPSRVVNGTSFYNHNIELGFSYWDGYAGIESWNFAVNGGVVKQGEFKSELKDTVFTESTILDMNMNDISVTAGYVDNAGYTKSASATYNIDKVAPTITVTYDLNEPANELYYNATRTAVVEIQERNFQASDVEFTITNTDGTMPTISGWTSSGAGDNTVHRCTVTFAADGDYTFTVAFMDMAGNKATYDRVDTFTIDQTLPVYTVTYDNNDVKNGYYYNAGRTATIEIVEHNFDASLINIVMSATNGTNRIPTVSAWSRTGDVSRATIEFADDSDYTFDISGADLALNPMDDYAQDMFVIDTTNPELSIDNVESLKAYAGEIRPLISYMDINYDADNTEISLVGYHNGEITIDGNKTVSDTEVVLELYDLAREQGMDDIYTLSVVVYDLAGNKDEGEVIYAVNRFGSVYVFDDATEALVGEGGSYYTQNAPDLVVTETNVSGLVFKNITCTWNGTLIDFEEGKQYTVEESGSEVSWKQYTYTISKDNFTEDGTYILTIYSEDSANNTSDNTSKGKKIEFIVDAKAPSVVISGVENEVQYRESEKTVYIDVQDNVLLSKVDVTVNGITTTYTAEQIDAENGKIPVKLTGANDWQTLQVVAYDVASNELATDEMQFLITTNLLVQYYMNKKLFFGSIAALVAAGGGIFFVIFGKKRKKKQ